tara:strand:- start:4217 stop:5266 length:1050 start_codon:yes stop_codon:yes gene_type:complete
MKNKKIFMYWPKIRLGGLEKSFFAYLESLSKIYSIVIICDFESSKYNKFLQEQNIRFIYTKNNKILRILYTIFILLNNKYDFLFAVQKDSLKLCVIVKFFKKLKLLYFDRINQLNYENIIERYWLRISYFIFIRFADKIFVNSDHLYRFLRLKLKSKKKIYRIYNPSLDMSMEKYYKKKDIQKSIIKIVLAGRNVTAKNFNFVIENAHLLKKHFGNYKMDIYTDNFLSNIDNENINFLNFDEKIISKLCNYDILIFPSLYEGFPNLLLEASYLGLTTVHSNFRFGSSEFKILENCHKFNLKNLSSFENALLESKKTFYKNYNYFEKTNKFFNNFNKEISCEDLRKKIII